MIRLSTVGALAAIFLLTGCGASGSIFGYSRAGPDEFTVVQTAPLSLPPDATLRPPARGSERPQANSVQANSRSILLGDSAAAASYSSPKTVGETALANRAVAYYGSRSDIRRLVDAESDRLAKEQESFVHTLVFWKDPEPPGTVLDADQEARRLQENAALGKPLNSATVPIIVRRKSGFSSLF